MLGYNEVRLFSFPRYHEVIQYDTLHKVRWMFKVVATKRINIVTTQSNVIRYLKQTEQLPDELWPNYVIGGVPYKILSHNLHTNEDMFLFTIGIGR